MPLTARYRAVLGVPLLDVVLAGVVVALSVGGLVSGDVDEMPLALTLPVAVVIGLSLLGRTRIPLVAAMVTTTACVVQGIWGNQSPGTLMALVVLLLLAYSIGAEFGEGVASLGLGIMLAGMFVSEWLDGGSDYPFIAVEMGGSWLLGRAVRTWRSRATYAEQHQRDLARLAVADERARIARELHDVVAHSLSVIAVQADAAEAAVVRAPSLAGEPLRAIRASAREALVDMRQLLHVLRSDDLNNSDDDPGPGHCSARTPARGLADLSPLVQGLREAGLPLEADVRVDAASVPSGIELAVYRIAQEALTNVLKHAGAVPTRLTVEGSQDVVRVVVRNDAGSQARPPVADGRSGHGLIGLRERALAAGGSLHSGHTADGGFELVATLPIAGESA